MHDLPGLRERRGCTYHIDPRANGYPIHVSCIDENPAYGLMHLPLLHQHGSGHIRKTWFRGDVLYDPRIKP